MEKPSARKCGLEWVMRCRSAMGGAAGTNGEAAFMRGQRLWIHQGQIEPMSVLGPKTPEEEERLYQDGSIRITTGELGTEVKWLVNSACVRSAFKAMQWLPSAKAPFILRFYAMGWFEEVYRRPESVVKRLEELLARGDRHFTSRIFVMERPNDAPDVPQVLKETLAGHETPEEYAVECSFDSDSHLFKVERVGAKSAIGRVWGTYTSSFPCQTAGTYGDTVNATYEEVLRTGQPRYDQVLAALRLPDNAVHWVPYHRVIRPMIGPKKVEGVSVISQIARVDIKVL